MSTSDPKRIVVFGRTGAGKSSLGNQIFGAEQFKEGHTLISETTSCQEKVFKWPKHPSPTVSYIDTPGFADNRPEISNGHIINSIFELLKNLKGGINVALFCLAAKSRLDAFDMDEIKMLQTILGEGIYEHLWIVITRMDTFEEETREKYYKQIPEELPLLLEAHGIKLKNPKERILFSDFSEFDTGFLNPVTKILMETPLYKPLNSLKLEQAADDENKFLYSSAMKPILEQYKGLFADNEKQLAQNVEDLKRRGSTTAFVKKQLERKEKEIQQLQEKRQHLDQITAKVINDEQREIQQLLEKRKHLDQITAKVINDEQSPSKATSLFEILQKKKLYTGKLPEPLRITRCADDRHKDYSPHVHTQADDLNKGVDVTTNFQSVLDKVKVLTWDIWVRRSSPGFKYEFLHCPHSGKHCILFQYQEFFEYLPPDKINVIDLSQAPRTALTGYQKYICQLHIDDKKFNVYVDRSKDPVLSIRLDQ